MSDQAGVEADVEPEATVSELFIYPIKACRGIAVSTLTAGPTGPIGDRQWQVVDAAGRARTQLDPASESESGPAPQPVTQRTAPALATIAVALAGDGLTLSTDRHGSIDVPPPGSAAASAYPLVGGEVPVADAGDEVAAWLTAVIGQPARLVARTSQTNRRLPSGLEFWDQELSFVDLSPVLVANRASLDWLTERASEPFAMDRFRANVIVDGAAPWAEDTWGDFAIGPAQFTNPQPWPRCAVPQVNQLTGERHREPALVLKAHRWCTEAPTIPEPLREMFVGNALFGIGCGLGPTGAEISVGDRVLVTKTHSPVIPAL